MLFAYVKVEKYKYKKLLTLDENVSFSYIDTFGSNNAAMSGLKSQWPQPTITYKYKSHRDSNLGFWFICASSLPPPHSTPLLC